MNENSTSWNVFSFTLTEARGKYIAEKLINFLIKEGEGEGEAEMPN